MNRTLRAGVRLWAAAFACWLCVPGLAKAGLVFSDNPPESEWHGEWDLVAQVGPSAVLSYYPFGGVDFYGIGNDLMFSYNYQQLYYEASGMPTDTIQITGDWSGVPTNVTPPMYLADEGNVDGILPSYVMVSPQGITMGGFYRASDAGYGVHDVGNTVSGTIEFLILADSPGIERGSMQLVRNGSVIAEEDVLVPTSAIPEPSTVAMIATGLPLGLGFWCWKRRRAAV